jgi:hypothetical protein
MRIWSCLSVLSCGVLYAQSAEVIRRADSRQEIRGAAVTREGEIFTWGDGLHVWSLPDLKPRLIARGAFGEGGCLADLDGDGAQEFIGKEGPGLGRLTWRKPPDWKPVIIDDEFETHDCMEAELFGRKGILVIQRYMQVRFYERAEGKRWPFREIYSIYTPSQQTGLSMRDIDEDGHPDILCGNYWIKSPEAFELPWHIFAINTYSETPESAMLAHAVIENDQLAGQGHRNDARVTRFTKPGDPRRLWNPSPVEGAFHRVHAVTAWNGTFLFGENNGASSRIFALRDGKALQIADGIDSLQILHAKDALVSVGPHELVFWRYGRRK